MAVEIGHIPGVSRRGDTTAAYPSMSSEAIVDTRVVVELMRGCREASASRTACLSSVMVMPSPRRSVPRSWGDGPKKYVPELIDTN